MPFIQAKTVGILAAVASINAKTVATTTLYTVPFGWRAVVTGVVIEVTAFTAGGKSTQAVASMGANAASYNDYLSGVTYTVSAQDKVLHDENAEATEYPIYTATQVFTLNITTGSNATTETWRVHVLGFLVEA